MKNIEEKEISPQEFFSQAGYIGVAITLAALGGLVVAGGLIPTVIYIVVAFLPIIKIKPRNAFFKYGFIALALIAWAISSALIEGTVLDIKLFS